MRFERRESSFIRCLLACLALPDAPERGVFFADIESARMEGRKERGGGLRRARNEV